MLISTIEKRNIEKLKRRRGESNITNSGVPRLGKSIRPTCPTNCLFKCTQNITPQQRQQLFNDFYALADVNAQWQYIGLNLTRITPKYRKSPTVRRDNIAYVFIVNGVKVRVCKIYFHNTLGITKSVSDTALRKCDANGVLIEPDQRGYYKRNPVYKADE